MTQTKNKREWTNTSELRREQNQIHGMHSSDNDCISERKQILYSHAYIDKSG